MQAKNYDYIFLGAGCASLSVVMRMIDSKKFDQKKILLVDREPKTKNDRTWCFWEQEAGFFEEIVYRKWSNLFFKTDDTTIPLELDGYQYKMIRGIDFYDKCFSVIKARQNIDIIYGEISFEEDNKPVLQQRARGKYHNGGLWTNTCCSHPVPGEDVFTAANRRLLEEMGFATLLSPAFTFTYNATFANGLTEHEYDHVFTGTYDGKIKIDQSEVSDYCFKTISAIEDSLQTHPQKYTEWFKIALPQIRLFHEKNFINL